DGVQDTTTLTAAASFDGASWTVRVTNAGGMVVLTVSGSTSPPVSCTWDGTNDSSVVQADGVYTLLLTIADGGQTASTSATVTLDRTFPSSAISAPDGVLVSNVYQSGSADIDVLGTGSDANFRNWLLEYGSGSSPSSWGQVSSGTASISNAKIATWPTVGRTNGIYSLRLQVWDLEGNRS